MTIPATGLILVVDDNEAARYTKARTLRDAGYEVDRGGATAAMRCASSPSARRALVVLDVNLPGIDGWEVCRRLKADPDTASVAVLQVSATLRARGGHGARARGRRRRLASPSRSSRPCSIATVRALLRARHAEDALRDALAREQVARAAAESAEPRRRTSSSPRCRTSCARRSAPILTWVTLLRSGASTTRGAPRALEAIERNTRLQAQLIEDLLDVSRIISGKLRLDVERRWSSPPSSTRRSRRAPGRATRRASQLDVVRDRDGRSGRPATPPACSRWSGTCSPTPSSSRRRAAASRVARRARRLAGEIRVDRQRRGHRPGVPAAHLRALPPGGRVDDAHRRAGSGSGSRSSATSSSCTAAASRRRARGLGHGAHLHRAPAAARGAACRLRRTTPRAAP